MTELNTRVINLNSFGSDIVTNFFGFLDTTKTEQDCMRFLFKIFGGETGVSGQRLERIQTIAQISIEKIHFRFEMFKHHAKFFPLSGEQQEYDALSIAVICDEYTLHINERLQKNIEEDDENLDDEEDLPSRDDGIDELLSSRACYIWEVAGDIELHGIPDDLEFPEPEAVFLAHINVMDNLREMEAELDQYPRGRLLEIVKKDFPRYRTFLCHHTTIGADVGEWMQRVEVSINSMLNTPQPPTRPQLRLVPSSPQ